MQEFLQHIQMDYIKYIYVVLCWWIFASLRSMVSKRTVWQSMGNFVNIERTKINIFWENEMDVVWRNKGKDAFWNVWKTPIRGARWKIYRFCERIFYKQHLFFATMLYVYMITVKSCWYNKAFLYAQSVIQNVSNFFYFIDLDIISFGRLEV